MNPTESDDLFGRTFVCECGKTHRIEPHEVLYADDAAERVAAVSARQTAGRRATVLADVRTRAAAGARAEASLAAAGWDVAPLVVPDPKPGFATAKPGYARAEPGVSPVCDDRTKAWLAERLGPADLILAVGGGVVTDLGKWLAFERGVPLIAFATAASMNGYASANVAPTIAMVKTLVRARPPAVVAAEPHVLAEAPYELTAAGLGDILARFTSSADWYLNHFLFGDYYCAKAVGLTARADSEYLARPEALRARRPEAIEGLFRALLASGAAMTMADSSAPASGGEHLLSHTLDMQAALRGEEHDLHGRQVGLGTILAAEIYRRVMALESPRFADPPAAVDARYWAALTPAVADEYGKKVERLREARTRLSAEWDRLRDALRPMLRPPETIRDCLARAGAAHRAEHIGCTKDRLLAALQHAHEMRSRVTVLDLARLAGVMPGAAAEIVEQWS